jgi:hypothetical protein
VRARFATQCAGRDRPKFCVEVRVQRAQIVIATLWHARVVRTLCAFGVLAGFGRIELVWKIGRNFGA